MSMRSGSLKTGVSGSFDRTSAYFVTKPL
jgi:hypothetical protein